MIRSTSNNNGCPLWSFLSWLIWLMSMAERSSWIDSWMESSSIVLEFKTNGQKRWRRWRHHQFLDCCVWISRKKRRGKWVSLSFWKWSSFESSVHSSFVCLLRVNTFRPNIHSEGVKCIKSVKLIAILYWTIRLKQSSAQTKKWKTWTNSRRRASWNQVLASNNQTQFRSQKGNLCKFWTLNFKNCII